MTEYQAEQLKDLLADRGCYSLFERISQILETPDLHPLEIQLLNIERILGSDPKFTPILDLVIHPELTTEQIREVGVASNTAINRYGSFNSIQNQDYMITTIHESIMKLCKVRSD